MHRRHFLLASIPLIYSIRPGLCSASEQPVLEYFLGKDWRVPYGLQLDVWPSKWGMDLSEIITAVADWTVPSSSRITIRLTDGEHQLKGAVTPRNIDGDRLFILGNIKNPELCRLLWGRSSDFFYVGAGKQIGMVDGVTLEHTNLNARGNGSAFLADNTGVIRCGSSVIVRNFYYGFQARYGGVIQCAGTKCSNGGDANYFAFNGGHISAQGAHADRARDDLNGLGSGFVAEYGGTINAAGASASYNALAGFVALSNGVIRAYDSVAEHNGKAGYYTNTGGVIVAHRGAASNNCGEGLDTGNQFKGFEGVGFKVQNNRSDPKSCR